MRLARLLAIDPGPTHSAYVITDTNLRPVTFGKVTNDAVRGIIMGTESDELVDVAAIEMIASYGMPVGVEVFDTCRWVGRFEELTWSVPVQIVYRRDIKLHLCGSARANDANIRQALVDRFAPGERNHGKGTKAAPGWFHGFHSDIWAAYAVAVYAADTLNLNVKETP